MTPEEFFAIMTAEDCVVSGAMEHVDYPGTPPCVFQFENVEVFQMFMEQAPDFAKLVGHDGKVSITISCSCGEIEPLKIDL